MIRKIFFVTALCGVLGVLVFTGMGCTQENASARTPLTVTDMDNPGDSQTAAVDLTTNDKAVVPADGIKGRTQGSDVTRFGSRNSESHSGVVLPARASELSSDETAALLYMREEEKLAHDVYVTLYEQWDLPVFQKISQSEQTHTEAVKKLLDRYGLSDPASDTVGIFTDPNLQALFTDLVARGSQSLGEALKVGAAIEEIDILDLQDRLKQTDKADIQQVFSNLLSGSQNHLRAFASNLKKQTGEVYQPQYIRPEAYQEIIGISEGNGNGRGGNGGGGRGGRP